MALCGTEGRDEGGGEEGIKFREVIMSLLSVSIYFLGHTGFRSLTKSVQNSKVYLRFSLCRLET